MRGSIWVYKVWIDTHNYRNSHPPVFRLLVTLCFEQDLRPSVRLAVVRPHAIGWPSNARERRSCVDSGSKYRTIVGVMSAFVTRFRIWPLVCRGTRTITNARVCWYWIERSLRMPWMPASHPPPISVGIIVINFEIHNRLSRPLQDGLWGVLLLNRKITALVMKSTTHNCIGSYPHLQISHFLKVLPKGLTWLVRIDVLQVYEVVVRIVHWDFLSLLH